MAKPKDLCYLIDQTIKNCSLEEDMDDAFWMELLKGACEYANEEFSKEQKYVDTSKSKICNLCRHYSLMNLKCQKTNDRKNSKDTCKEWEE